MIREGGSPLYFHVTNAGLNVAVDVTAYLVHVDAQIGESEYVAVLSVGGRAGALQVRHPWYQGCHLVCEYKNLWGDAYQIRAPIERPDPTGLHELGHEEFQVLKVAD